jgi:alanyl-tRNA synthetase
MKRNPGRVAAVIRDEEESFLRTLDRGLALFDEAAQRAAETGARIGAEDAFRLHDTFGFPIDLTRVMAVERGLAVDEAGYERLMDEARTRSRAAAGGQEAIAPGPEAIARLKHLGVRPTDDEPKYEMRPVGARVEAIFNGQDFDEHAHVGRRVAVILNRTNHYAEAGGQVGDAGELRTTTEDFGLLPLRGFGAREGRPETRFEVEDTRSSAGYVLHIGHVTAGELRVGDHVTAQVRRTHREPVLANHTATHLLNLALREVVGPEEDQKGSLVAPDRLRFDFTCPHALTPQQIARTEAIVNEAIAAHKQVHAATMPLAVARSINGVRAVFGEKYPDPVRVVTIGCLPQDVEADPGNERWCGFSIELCGGTHLRDTAEARRFVIVHEQALAAGVRRVTALTGHAAEAAEAAARASALRLDEVDRLDDQALPPAFDEVARRVEAEAMPAAAKRLLQERIEALRQRVREARRAQQAAARAGTIEEARRLAASATGPIIVGRLPGTDRKELLAALDAVRARHAEAAVMLVGSDEEAVAIVARVPEPLMARGLRAGDWVRVAAEACGGRGGGRPDMAQAGGRDPRKVPEAIAAARAWAEGAGR